MSYVFDISQNNTLFNLNLFKSMVFSPSNKNLARVSHATCAGETQIPAQSLTLEQLNGVVFALKPTNGRLQDKHILDIKRQTTTKIFNNVIDVKSPNVATSIAQLLNQRSTLARQAILRMLGLELFTQQTFLFALPQTIAEQLANQNYSFMPHSDSAAPSSLTINELNDFQFEVVYENHLAYFQVSGAGKIFVLDGTFKQTMIFTVCEGIDVSREFIINTFLNYHKCLFLKVEVTCAEYTVNRNSRLDILSRLGFKQIRQELSKSPLLTRMPA